MIKFIGFAVGCVLLCAGTAQAANNAPYFLPGVASGACNSWPNCPAVPNDATHAWFFAPATGANMAQETGGNLAALVTAQANPGSDASKAFAVQGVSGGKPVAVSGTVTSTPSGTQNTNQVSGIPTVSAASGSITVQDTGSSSTAGAYGVNYFTGTPTAGSFVTQAVSGIALARVQIAGTFTGTVQIEASQDGGTTWRASGGHVNGSVYTASTFTAPGSAIVGIGGTTNIRVRATAAMTGTVNVTMVFDNDQTAVYVLGPVALKDNTSGAQLAVQSGGTIGTSFPLVGSPVAFTVTTSSTSVTGLTLPGKVRFQASPVSTLGSATGSTVSVQVNYSGGNACTAPNVILGPGQIDDWVAIPSSTAPTACAASSGGILLAVQ